MVGARNVLVVLFLFLAERRAAIVSRPGDDFHAGNGHGLAVADVRAVERRGVVEVDTGYVARGGAVRGVRDEVVVLVRAVGHEIESRGGGSVVSLAVDRNAAETELDFFGIEHRCLFEEEVGHNVMPVARALLVRDVKRIVVPIEAAGDGDLEVDEHVVVVMPVLVIPGLHEYEGSIAIPVRIPHCIDISRVAYRGALAFHDIADVGLRCE